MDYNELLGKLMINKSEMFEIYDSITSVSEIRTKIKEIAKSTVKKSIQ